MNRNTASKMETTPTITLAMSGAKDGGKPTLLRETHRFAEHALHTALRPQLSFFACASPAGSRT